MWDGLPAEESHPQPQEDVPLWQNEKLIFFFFGEVSLCLVFRHVDWKTDRSYTVRLPGSGPTLQREGPEKGEETVDQPTGGQPASKARGQGTDVC